MDVTLDRFGRILIPKPIREQLGLKPGAALRLEASEDAISLIPARSEPLLEDAGGVLVFTGELVGDPGQVTEQLEEERLRKLAGL